MGSGKGKQRRLRSAALAAPPGAGKTFIDAISVHRGISSADKQALLRMVSAYKDPSVEELCYGDAAPLIGFRAADEIALRLGCSADSAARVDAGIIYAVEQAERRGDVFLTPDAVSEAVAKTLGVDTGAVQARLTSETDDIAIDPYDIVIDPDGNGQARVYSRELYDAEAFVADRVAELMRADSEYSDSEVRGYLGSVAGNNLTQEQQQAIEGVLRNRFSILTGGPGTGKTHSLRSLVELMDAAGIDYELAAPTGKAAKRLSELTGKPASTIHRLLKWSPSKQAFQRNQGSPLTSKVLVVDEASMIDLRLADSLLSAVGEHQHVLLVGDKDQLPSVGAGKVFDDLLAVPGAKVTKLDKIFRQAQRSLIVQNSRRINAGEFPYTQTSDVDGVAAADVVKDFFLVRRKENDDILETTVDHVVNRIPRQGYDPVRDVQVLAPMRSGPVGLDALNAALQEKLNPGGEAVGHKDFRVGDKIIQTKNNYDYDLMNGETAIIKSVSEDGKDVELEGMDGADIGAVPVDKLHSFLLAYAISIHRSQGSQAPAVVIPASTSQYTMLKRNLLYTAVTRAEKLCYVIGQAKAVAIATHRVDTTTRNSGLTERINKSLGS